MAINFPNSPSVDQIYTDPTSGFSFKWDGTVWNSYASVSMQGTLREIDDISGSFNGVLTTFPLTISGAPETIFRPEQLVLSLGGVVQNPTEDYGISGTNIVFTTPPAAGLSFFATLIARNIEEVGYSTASNGIVYQRQKYPVVGVQTTFNFSTGYTPGYLEVFKNGVKLIITDDYTASDGITFDLVSAAQPGDEIEALGYFTSSVGIITSAAVGGGVDQIFYENGQTVNTSYSITAGKNAMTAGPVTIAIGATVTVPSGSTWTIV